MNKKERMYQQIRRHGENLHAIYPKTATIDAVELCKKLHRLEVRASRMCEDMCNFEVDQDDYEKKFLTIEKQLKNILGDGPEVFINRDPRGYALKIRTDEAKALNIHKDWGGYGIICPEFNGD